MLKVNRRLKVLQGCNRGVSAVEFALITPVILMAMLGLFDYGMAMYNKIELTSAVRSGAQFAMLDASDIATIQSVVSLATNLDPTTITVTPTPFCECANGTTITCGNACADGSSNRYFLTVSAVHAFTPLFLPTTLNVTASTTVRTQ